MRRPFIPREVSPSAGERGGHLLPVRRFSAGFLLCLGLLLIAVPGTVSAGSTQDAAGPPVEATVRSAPGAAKVEFDPVTGKLGVEAVDADLAAVLQQVAERSRIEIEVGSGVAGNVTAEFADLGLEEGVSAILSAAGEQNLAAQYVRGPGHVGSGLKIEKISVLRKGTVGTGSAMSGIAVEALEPSQLCTTATDLPSPVIEGGGTPGLVSRTPIGTGTRRATRQTANPRGGMQHAVARGVDQQRARALMRAAIGKDMRAISLLGQMGVQEARPILQRIVARSPEESPERQAAESALRRLSGSRPKRRGQSSLD